MKNPFSLLTVLALTLSALYAAPPSHDDRYDDKDKGRHDERTVSKVREKSDRDRSERDVATRKKDNTPQRTSVQPLLRTHASERILNLVTPKVRVPLRHPQSPRTVYRTLPRSPVLAPYQRPGYYVRTLPSAVISLMLGDVTFYYASGIYYRRHIDRYVVTLPPPGLIVPLLPAAHVAILLNGTTYYYYGGIYYLWDDGYYGYRVVDAPSAVVDDYRPGDVVDRLPDGAYSVTINGIQYYRYRGLYFLQTIQNERIVYVVVTP